MSEPMIRLTRPNDINTLQTLDLKSYHYPMPLVEWQERVKGSGQDKEARIVICEVMHKPVGFAMWSTGDMETGHLLRIGVMPRFRRKNIGRLLVESCARDLCKSGCEAIKVVVPHIHCCPGDDDDVSEFLRACEFYPNGKVIHDWRRMYGNDIDGYEFERKIDVFAC